MSGLEASGVTSAVDADRQLVFGWAYVTHDATGNVVVDKSGEFVDDYEEIETAAYDFVVKSRRGGLDHAKDVTVSTLVESVVFTPEKVKAMGIAPGVLPTGWWVGFRVQDPEAWQSVKNGERLAFSVHGTGLRETI